MKIDQHENSIRSYLLGELAEADQTAFEQELLADRGKFDHVWTIENELIDSYVRGEMSRADRRRFEGHYLASPLHRERVAIAELFLKNIDQPPGETVEGREKEPGVPWWGWFPQRRPHLAFGGAVVMALLLTSGAVWSYLEKVRLTGRIVELQNEAQTQLASLKQREEELTLRNRELEKGIADGHQGSEQMKAALERMRKQTQSALPAVFSFLLRPATLRSENATPPPVIPLLKRNVRLLIELESNDYQSYRVRLQTVEGREILHRRTNKVSFGKDRAYATLTIPAAKSFAKGDYVLILSGLTADGRTEEVDRYFFQVL